MPKPTTAFYKNGIQFECQGSGRCCVSRGQYGYVYLTLSDRRRFAKHLGLKTVSFTSRFCDKTDGFFHLKDRKDTGNCIFLDGTKCTAYEARPIQCRTWPFWPEVMNAKAWKTEVASYCPGVGKGRTWTQKEIEKQMKLHSQSEVEMDREALANS